jgi:Zn-dependent protease
VLSGWRIGSIGGVEIRVDPSLFLIATLVTFNLWLQFSERFRHLGSGTAVSLAGVTAVLFFASILVHELAHAGMSIARRIPVLGITLWMFGGATHARVEARGPADEFLVTVVGPLSSAALGGLFLVLNTTARGLGGPVAFMFGYLGVINLLLAAFNLLPGFPLDGGRLLRSGIWKLTGSLSTATRVAGRIGQGVALLIVAYGLYRAVEARALGVALWPALIGWFLYRAAGDSLADEQRRLALRSTTAREVMTPAPPTIAADLPIAEATERYLRGHEGEAFPVVDNGRVAGFVSLDSVRASGPNQPVRDALIGSDVTTQAAPEETMDVVLDRASEDSGTRSLRTVLVVEDGRVVGVIEPGDLARYLRGRVRHAGRR